MQYCRVSGLSGLLRGSGEGWARAFFPRPMNRSLSKHVGQLTKRRQQQKSSPYLLYLRAARCARWPRGHLDRKLRRCLSTDVHTSQQVGHSCCNHLESVGRRPATILRPCVDGRSHHCLDIQHRAGRCTCACSGRQRKQIRKEKAVSVAFVVGGASHADWATFRFVFRFVQTSRQHPWGCSRALVAMRMSR